MNKQLALELLFDAFGITLSDNLAGYLVDELQRFDDAIVVRACLHLVNSLTQRPGNMIAVLLATCRDETASSRAKKRVEEAGYGVSFDSLPDDLQQAVRRFVNRGTEKTEPLAPERPLPRLD